MYNNFNLTGYAIERAKQLNEKFFRHPFDKFFIINTVDLIAQHVLIY